MDLKGKRILITGASRGIGLAHARYFASLGASLILSSRHGSIAQLQAIAAEMGGQAEVFTAAADLPAEAAQLVEAATERLGGLDAIVHNAGSVSDRSVLKMTQQDWQSVQDVHLGSAFILSKAAWPVFKAQKYGRLVFTSSSAGLYGNFGQANYSAAKMGLVGLARSLAAEGQRHNIAANCIAPVAITEMNRHVLSAELGTRLPASAISPLAAYLCHPACGENGSVFEAAGGHVSKVFIAQGPGKTFPVKALSLSALHDGWEEVCASTPLRFPADAAESLRALMANLPQSPEA